ncbi:Predicted ATP-dependent carboligase, ATP-grasp superfamily [Quadrisphaera granulorum]|uniref:Putative ATP-grasp superfamily ATP-dependent carboligase n=1 Tax=Quadrisphaera granulorum TaxID=317664 RepID=A0A316ADH3_9ACTN|nr:PAC2 family protein [Quadrisphaera granulorum]PWJ55662.1 putative ATP-grasp superfamily ATP-dependent carboligase [Quadrisphaera granulorum]SZE95159.1 Predicted ATP-dependent carboligase, ATP-grasp superfamily [Quadrisphaera granulorum]
MLAPEDLYEVTDEPSPGSVLVHALTGFVDAGAASQLVATHLLGRLESRVIARFDVDLMHDYRGRRPPMTFTGDRFEDVDLPELVLHELRDEADTPFLLLAGAEPDLHWQRFAAAIHQLTQRAEVRLAVSLQGIPWAAPHTRPAALTAHASDRALITGRPRWFDAVVVPGHAGAFVELALAKAGLPSMGFSVHVPHYLGATAFPPSAVALLEALSQATGLQLDGAIAELANTGVAVLAQVDEQVAASAETREAVSALEHQYDAVAAGRGLTGPSLVSPHLPEDEVADGDELAAQLEAFLRAQEGPPQGQDGSAAGS